jgi:methionyl-tRNA formyltransferase
LLGQKGYQVLNAAIIGDFKEHLRLVVVGKDPQIHGDFSDEIFSLCENHAIPCCERNDFVESSLAYEDHVAFASGWRWLIKEPFRQILVFHDSLLPKYRGFNPLVTALLKKDSEIGVTALIANKDFDCGDIVGSRSTEIIYPVRVADAIQLVSKLYFDLANSLFATVAEAGFLKGIPQDEAQASYSVWRDDEDYRINWSWSADKITHFINSLSYPYKGASTVCDGEMIRILHAEPISDVVIANRDVGKVLFIKDEKPVVICGSGLLRITAATDNEGRNALPFKKFRSRLK